jgi:hypothetical protein
MAERKWKSDAEREYHLSEVARLYLQGKYQSEIALAREVNQSQISRDLEELQQRWRESGLRDISLIINEQLAKIDFLEREASAAWERSKMDKEVSFSEKNDTSLSVVTDQSSASNKPAQVRTKTYIRREGQTGNPSYFSTLQWCIDQRCKILGLLAPTRSISLDVTNMSDDELRAIAAGKRPSNR